MTTKSALSRGIERFFGSLPEPRKNISLHREADTALRSFLARSSVKKDLLFAFVFGSFAKRTMKSGSDIDIVLVRKKAKPGIKVRIIKVRGFDIHICDGPVGKYKEILKNETGAEIRIWGNILTKSCFVCGSGKAYSELKEQAGTVIRSRIPRYKRDHARNIVEQFRLIIPGEMEKLARLKKKTSLSLWVNSFTDCVCSVAHRLDNVPKPHWKEMDDNLSHLKHRPTALLLKRTILTENIRTKLKHLTTLTRLINHRLLK